MTLKTKVCVSYSRTIWIRTQLTLHMYLQLHGPNKDLMMSSNIKLSLIRMYTVIKIRKNRS